MLRVVEKVASPNHLISQWDALAPVRFRQITTGRDLTYVHVLAPSMLALVPRETQSAIDAGCGIGFFTNEMAKVVETVIGIDPSPKSIEIARNHFSHSARFERMTMEEYAVNRPGGADVVVANMVLMDVLELKSFVKAASRALRANGVFLFSITHPCFWPFYRGYAHEPWFTYSQETSIEAPFRISTEPNCELVSTHVHRPLHAYFQAIEESGFCVERVTEPMPSQAINSLYPEPWRYPRYLIARCRAASTA